MSLEQYLRVTRIFLTVISFCVLRSVFKIPHFSPTLRFFLCFWHILLCNISILDLFNLHLIDLYPPSNPLVNEDINQLFYNFPPSNPLVNEDINQLFYNFPISKAELIEIIEEIIEEREQAKKERYVWIILPSIVCCVTFTIAIYTLGRA